MKKAHIKDTGHENLHCKDSKIFLVNMPKKIGLPSGTRYYFYETEKGYTLNLGKDQWIGMPKIIIENNPQLYTLIRKGGKL